MEQDTAAVEQVTLSDILELATWQRARSSDELKSFRFYRKISLI
jgi:hypothetical protein